MRTPVTRRPTPVPTICCALALTLALGLASAEVASVTVDASEPFEKVRGYTYVEATMHGIVTREDGSVGAYAVPLVLIFPDDGGNGVGVVDVPNSVFHWGTGFVPDPDGTLQLTRQATDGFLFDEGYTYASVQWNKEVTDLFADDPGAADQNHLASGSIERTSDAWHILRDAAGFLRDPSPLVGLDGRGPAVVDTVLSSGYSQTGTLMQAFVFGGENAVGGEIAFDGHLIGTGGFSCGLVLDEGTAANDAAVPLWDTVPCDPGAAPPADGSVSVAIITEATAGFLGAPRFAEEPAHWRQYELAGVAHTNPAITPDGPLMLSENRNPVVHVPVFRAALANLARWASDGEPAPPSVHLAGEVDPETGGLVPEVDDDGNALGGLRLPHMAHEVDGRSKGAPLGTYTGLNPAHLDAFLEPPSLDTFAGVLTSIGGTFTPFGEDELRSRYPDHEAYVERVRRAADHLLAGGYILEADRDAYIREAERHPLGP